MLQLEKDCDIVEHVHAQDGIFPLVATNTQDVNSSAGILSFSFRVSLCLCACVCVHACVCVSNKNRVLEQKGNVFRVVQSTMHSTSVCMIFAPQ